jgi:hypothetical protein
MAVRVPAIIDGVIERNPDYSPAIRDELARLRDGLVSDARLPPLDTTAPGSDEWRAGLTERANEGWLSTDWLFAETYAYRKLVDAARFWDARRDPFFSNKREEYESATHAEALERALALGGSKEEHLQALLGAALFGNRIDLSFAASRTRGTATDADDILADDREAAVLAFMRGKGPFHVIADNAGTELTLDLALADFALDLDIPVVFHVKVHPCFVSDAIPEDIFSFLGLGGGRSFAPRSTPSRAMVERLRTAAQSERLQVRSHPFWNGPSSLWELPDSLANDFAQTRLVLLKGDANYRRATNDAIWPPETPFRDVLSYFPAPILALRTLKSDTLVGLAPGRAAALDRSDATWRVNGKHGVASLGGRGAHDSG